MPSTSRKCCRSYSQSVLLLLVWAFLTTLLILYCFATNFIIIWYYYPENVYYWVSLCVSYTVMLSLPIAGWIAESWLGRYRTIISGFLIATVGILLQFLATSTIPLRIHWHAGASLIIVNEFYSKWLCTVWSIGCFHQSVTVSNGSDDRSIS